MKIIPILKTLNREEQPVLAGRLAGEADLSVIKKALQRTKPGEIVVLDLSNIEVITSSYFLGGLWPLWSANSSEQEGIFPVLANIPDDCQDDVRIALSAKQTAAWLGIGRNGSFIDPSLIGSLDSLSDETLKLVSTRGEITAGDLFTIKPEVGSTAWSNRLAALYQQRLVRRHKEGRRLSYSISWKE